VITRRRLLAAIALGAMPGLPAFAQSTVSRIGVLISRFRPEPLEKDAMGEFSRAMVGLGHNLQYEWRFAEDEYRRLPDLASQLAKLRVDVLLTEGTPATHAAKQATQTIPIVMVASGDPVGTGLIKTLAQPGGNVTGLSQIGGDVTAKQLDLLLSMVRRLTHVAYIINPNSPASVPILKDLQAAAQKIGVDVMPLEARNLAEIQSAFAAAKKARVHAILVANDLMALGHRAQIVVMAAKNRMPAAYGYVEYAEAGGLLSYGPSLAQQYRRASAYVDKILKGAKPAGLPVEQASRFELAINLKTAKALGLKILPSTLQRADRVID
jgi:putative ABC transport system substrate-binding protein